MAVISKLSRMMEERGTGTVELAARVGITLVNLSRIKTGRVRSIRFSTLNALCRELECEPGDILGYSPDEKPG
ncbi:helix-turn-helix domain-containing protein [Gordonibacter urolithinfaciens]|uniref:Helix-turn-helix domain-containing protein n=1 Tax=Gordonibacter urolithinfaciens TaxID=1335613 RepID=A0A6N8IIH6_9ACTN|nr:helix-turn-helix transcriptional regulator [Gordonibacter urolithinfaciens]MVM54466.1 helix-turn-helix domain-containing protein [Gordonibacter urolithinfaciens]MVN15056.1 helix-turn-helix domain-containing protein [Gordonibacter urolithinfaciens]MVN38564.1 helix-turn-helix domain-containing protein [Gordonibacter urolithinfaciens]MVN55222.1 helix-turn-helix domain-containing protein [Gordonibacter urolithinfaciens]MVN60534.1 helix-turn-helix domain-containing protein [Gordonibacter urolith